MSQHQGIYTLQHDDDGDVTACECCSAGVPVDYYSRQMANSKQIDVPLCEICASTFFCTITQFDHYSPDTQKLAQSLGMAFNILRQDIRAALPVPPTHPTMQKAMTRVVQAARAVVQWDWSDNDADCVADMDKLTKAIADLDALNAALGGVTPE